MNEKEILYGQYSKSGDEMNYFIDKYHNEVKFLNFFSSGIFSTVFFNTDNFSIDSVRFLILEKSEVINYLIIFVVYLMIVYLFLLILNSSNEIIIASAKMSYYEQRLNKVFGKNLLIWETYLSEIIRYNTSEKTFEDIDLLNDKINYKKIDKINKFSKKIEKDNLILGIVVFIIFFLVNLFIGIWIYRVIIFFNRPIEITYFVGIFILTLFIYHINHYLSVWIKHNLEVREILEYIGKIL